MTSYRLTTRLHAHRTQEDRRRHCHAGSGRKARQKPQHAAIGGIQMQAYSPARQSSPLALRLAPPGRRRREFRRAFDESSLALSHAADALVHPRAGRTKRFDVRPFQRMSRSSFGVSVPGLGHPLTHNSKNSLYHVELS
jgi:hypothetical protein